jgi:hypothetical protein
MKSVLSAAVVTALMAMSLAAQAMEDMDIKKMDANGDGMISKSEFMKYHEAMWSKMKKNKNGMVNANDMATMQDEMAKGDKMQPGMKSDKMKGDSANDKTQSGTAKDENTQGGMKSDKMQGATTDDKMKGK